MRNATPVSSGPARPRSTPKSRLQAWIKSNIIPLLLLVIAVMLFVVAQRGDNAKAMRVVARVVIALGVLGLATGGHAESFGSWLSSLVTG